MASCSRRPRIPTVERSYSSDVLQARSGHYLQFDGDGTLIAITIVNARRILEREGKIPITLPSHRIEATDLGAVLTPA